MIPEDGEIEIYELTEDSLLETARAWCFDECVCAVEDVASSPQMGVKSAFSFGQGFGFIQGVLRANAMSYELVRPVKWKKVFSCQLGKDATTKEKKEKDYTVAKRLFPNVDFRRTPKCRTPWYDAADAVLLAEYARRNL